MMDMTTDTNPTAHTIADKVIASLPDADMLAQLMTDEGLTVDGMTVWYREGDGRIVVWAGNDNDPDMNRLVEVPWTTFRLFDGDTTDEIGPATAAQIEASLAAGDTGLILIDGDGDVVEDGTWAAQQPGVRKVFVA